MRRYAIVISAALLFSISAAAQGPAGAGAGGGGGSRSHRYFDHSDLSDWQISLGYQYNRINLLGTPFNTNGFNASIVRFMGSWFGVEGDAGGGFGNTHTSSTPPNLDAKSLFVGGGARVALRGHGPIEPWVHAAVGLEHFRFSQTAGVLGSNSGLAGEFGGGLDYDLTTHTAIRGEAEVLETRFFSLNQRNFQAGAGLVFNF